MNLLIVLLMTTAAADEENASQLQLLRRFRSEFVAITPGQGKFPRRFQLGDQEGNDAGARPLVDVGFEYNFEVAQYEMTQNLWESVMGSNPSRWKGPRNSVERVSFDEVQQFCQRVTQLMRAAKLIESQEVVRLPSEAEWEYVARAGTKTAYSFGDDADRLGEFAWYTGNAAGNDPAVGAKKPNPWGLYDIHGYLWEWCSDPWHPNYEDAPAQGKPWLAGGDAARRVVRGGSWKDPAGQLRCSNRRAVSRRLRDDAYGFRCVLAKE